MGRGGGGPKGGGGEVSRPRGTEPRGDREGPEPSLAGEGPEPSPACVGIEPLATARVRTASGDKFTTLSERGRTAVGDWASEGPGKPEPGVGWITLRGSLCGLGEGGPATARENRGVPESDRVSADRKGLADLGLFFKIPPEGGEVEGTLPLLLVLCCGGGVRLEGGKSIFPSIMASRASTSRGDISLPFKLQSQARSSTAIPRRDVCERAPVSESRQNMVTSCSSCSLADASGQVRGPWRLVLSSILSSSSSVGITAERRSLATAGSATRPLPGPTTRGLPLVADRAGGRLWGADLPWLTCEERQRRAGVARVVI